MALTPRLDLRQSQSLVMTPQLQQAIKLLALSSLEIDAYIAEQIEANPLLTREGSAENGGEVQDASKEDVSIDIGEMGSDIAMGGEGAEALDIDVNALDDHGDMMLSLNGAGSISGGGADDFSGDGPDFDSFAASEISLIDHLRQQAGACLRDGDLIIAHMLIDNIEPTGYMEADLLRLSVQAGVDEEKIEEVLHIIQTFDPSGVGARNLSECLAIQAREADRYDPCMAKLIDNLDLVAQGAFDRLKRMCRVDEEDLRDMLMELRNYDPKPGCRFDYDSPAAVTPDIFITRHKDKWKVELNPANIPRLLLNREYQAEFGGNGADKATKSWLNECQNEASWLIKMLDQRQRTIMKVAGEILKQQAGFFEQGVSALKQMTMRQVAEEIEMHESTVSRVTSNKYLLCERGMFELKYFFTSGIQSSEGDNVSAEAVKAAIKNLIDGEGDKILSDDKLVELLTQQNFDIARRTVAKYREAMGYGSSVQRRRQKRMGG
ncbi:RNA polymerase sigma-54 factor [Sphingorhabdus lutea]|uniref:RNA polymerase sigma-54 factor n=1 Tax=Sphingorhabdus lutea TaxID=1913578 RepID=A0A1L3J9Z9_9SPHN|nr:RNA polymerase factor sigma-54 [Sphingorhabdus lutea]APG61966.1 RNA polymerase sigma-54 factor [Sphingorhabdus lutea]